MRVPIEWLAEYTDIKTGLDDVAEKLTMAGLEVEEIAEMSIGELIRTGGVQDELDSHVMLTKVTPNRGDWLSMIGVARELSAVTGWDLRIPDPEIEGTGPDVASLIKISIADADLCNRYAGIVVRNVTIKESPDWMKNRLIRAGMRPINNIVDITNYVMLELGQPLHAFDYDLLAGHEIIVRRARSNEKMSTIDEVEREFKPDMLVIADRDKAVAVAGVMGGFASEVSSKTKNILIESANFDAVSIRRTSKALALVTESSYRFERGVDPGITDIAAKRAAELMKEFADGEIARGIVDVYPGKTDPRMIEISPERVNSLLGTKIAEDNMVNHLRALKFSATLNSKIVVTVPTFRPDVEREVDVIEEIARIHGYENIGVTLPVAPLQGRDSDVGRFVERLRGIFMACGMQEVLTHSLTDTHSARITGLADQTIAVRNPLSEDASKLRTMLAPNLLQIVARNRAVGQRDLSLFEIGKVYRWSPEGEVHEFHSVAAAMVGSQWQNAWNLSRDALTADFYFAKGALESILSRLDIGNFSFAPLIHPLLHNTRAAAVRIGDVEIGIIGEIAPEVQTAIDINTRAYMFELNVDALMSLVPEGVRYKTLQRFPALYRHLAVVVKRDVPYSEIKRSVLESGSTIIEDVELLEEFTGAQLGRDERSLTLSIVFRSLERTLTDEEVGSVLESIRLSLTSKFEARFRG